MAQKSSKPSDCNQQAEEESKSSNPEQIEASSNGAPLKMPADQAGNAAFQPRSNRETEVMAAFHRLGIALQLASAYDPTQPDHGRGSARLALIGVLNFLGVIFAESETLPVALQDLLQGLVDLDRGTVIPLLTPADVRGRPPNPLGEHLLRGLAAAAMTRLMQDKGMSRERAAADIARKLNRLGYGPEKVSAGQVAKWRENMMNAYVREDLAAQRYHLALGLVKDMEAGAAVEFLLDSLRDMHPGEFPKKPAF